MTLLYRLTRSSVNPEKLSLTIQGLLISFIPLAILMGRFLEVELTEEFLMELILAATGIISAVVTLKGVLRKFSIN